MRPSVVALGGCAGLLLLTSLLAALGALGGPALALPLVLLPWLLLAALLAYLLLPGFDPRALWRATGAPLRRAPPHPSGAPSVALTFDDGPHPDTTPALLAALASSSVKATFFLVGEQARRFPDLVRRIVVAGHAVGNHTQRHRLLAFRRRDEIAAEIDECQATLRAQGLSPRLFRPPHGFKPLGLSVPLGRHGLRLVAWQGTLRDTDGPPPDELYRRALHIAAPGRILLLHDTPTTRGCTAAALPAIVDGYRRLGFRFVLLDERG